MADNEQNRTNRVDDEGSSNAEDSDEQAPGALGEHAKERQGVAGAAAPADDDIVIK